MNVAHLPIAPAAESESIEAHLAAAFAATVDPATLRPGTIAAREWLRLRQQLRMAYLLAERLQGHDRARIDAVLGRDRS